MARRSRSSRRVDDRKERPEPTPSNELEDEDLVMPPPEALQRLAALEARGYNLDELSKQVRESLRRYQQETGLELPGLP